jgi:choline dehydrogenase-like flavoprotein
MPVIVSANTNAPVQAIADHAADMIINDAKGQASS